MHSVAVVEDETLTRRAIALSLREAGFTVHEASGVLACRALLRQTRLDVIVLDLGLPGIDGMSFAREVRSSSDVIGLIVVTRQSAPEARIAALDLGADDYLVKPIHYGELAARIRSVMRRSDRKHSRAHCGSTATATGGRRPRATSTTASGASLRGRVPPVPYTY